MDLIQPVTIFCVLAAVIGAAYAVGQLVTRALYDAVRKATGRPPLIDERLIEAVAEAIAIKHADASGIEIGDLTDTARNAIRAYVKRWVLRSLT